MCNRKSEEDPAFMAQMFNDNRRQREGSIITSLLFSTKKRVIFHLEIIVQQC